MHGLRPFWLCSCFSTMWLAFAKIGTVMQRKTRKGGLWYSLTFAILLQRAFLADFFSRRHVTAQETTRLQRSSKTSSMVPV